MFKNRRILIVDDEPYNILGLKVLLTEASHLSILDYIDQASSGQEAVNKIMNTFIKGDYHYGLIFMDLNMPVLNGYETTDKIRSFYTKKNF